MKAVLAHPMLALGSVGVDDDHPRARRGYGEAVRALQAVGVRVLGYVPTGYGARTASP
jgi:hypothetical protein